jgi:hypothetical protein
MARTVQIHLIDDIDGSVAEETLKFSLDGTTYEIDLSAEHADQLRKSVARYIVAGRRATSGIATGGRIATKATSTRITRNQSQAIREWAKSAGIELSGRGRIPASVVERYLKDTSK